jgi:OmcA/MtrC family decaheme c-type cytochrome
MLSRHPTRRRAGALAVSVITAAITSTLGAGCSGPVVGPADAPAPPSTGYRLALTGGAIDADGRPEATFTLTLDGAPVAAEELARLRPSFTLAALLTDPVSGLAAWQSTVLNGATLARLPLGGPGTPPGLVLSQVRQPGAETGGTFTDLGGGAFRYAYATTLPAGFDTAVTFRAGAWLAGVPGADGTSATVDFAPAGGSPRARDTVLDARCGVCHGRLTAHGGFRAGVKLCLTCHTIQNADPDTADPAAPAQGLAVNPVSRTVVAGTGATSFGATLRHSTAAVAWTLSSGAPGTLSAASGASVTYTPPASVAGPVSLTLTAAAAGFSAPVAITVVPPAAPAPAVAVSPAAQVVVAAPGTPAVRFTARLDGVAAPVAWSISPASGGGTLSATTSAAVDWTPPGAVAAVTTVTITASAGGQSGSATVTLQPTWPGHATPATDPNPLDLGRLVHRIHRGKRLPTLYLSSSIAPAPALPSATALPLPFLPGRNAMAPGAKASVVGFRGTELLIGRISSRIENGQPAVAVAEGIGFPQDLRDCDACHLGAPQATEVVDAISRRTCHGCHPDVWFEAGPITDLVHFAHAGGPQADDSQCVTCHVTAPDRPVVRAPIAEAHVHPILSPAFSAPSVEIVGVTGLRPGERPTVSFTVTDRVGRLASLSAPTPATETGPTASPVPRALATLSLLLSGPAGDFLTGNAPLRESVPLTLASDAQGVFSYTFTAAVPAAASGTWALGAEARRRQAVPLYDPAQDLFRWPYTGETVTEYSDNPVVYVDTAFGSWPGGAPTPRRAAVDRDLCRNCHLDVTFHGGLRHSPEYCVMCHAPDATDWARRPKDPSGNVNLSTVYSATSFGTYDGLEERSIHFKVMIHRLHTGEGQGTARIEVGAPHVVAGLFLDEARFPARLANCLLCHPGETWSLEAIPAGAPPTTANESATIRHAAAAAHAAGEPQLLPITAACNSCHGTAWAAAHAAQYTTAAAGEQCAQCHTRGALGVGAAHGLPSTP